MQVERLELEIRRHRVFDSDAPATVAEIEELREKVVLHTYLKQQSERVENVAEIVLVPTLAC